MLSEVKIAFVNFKAKLLGGLRNLTAKFTYFSHSLDIRILISLKILHRVTSEILERNIYLFFNFVTLVTF